MSGEGHFTNRCRQCADEGADNIVVIEERTGLASCMDGTHNHAWFVWGPHAPGGATPPAPADDPDRTPAYDPKDPRQDAPWPRGPKNGG